MIMLIKRVKKFILPTHYKNIYEPLFVSHITYGISCWGGAYVSKLQKLFNIQKRCIRILFGESYSFDHPEFYATCARTRTYEEQLAPKDYSLEHTKPLFIKHDLLTLYNLYVSRSLVELLKILKYSLPISMHKHFKLCPESYQFRLIFPEYKLDITKNNYFVRSISLWNKCIPKLLDSPELVEVAYLKGLKLIIPGNKPNSDLTISIKAFKDRLIKFLLNIQKLGNLSDWSHENWLSD